MKAIFAAVVLGLAVVASSEVPSTSPVQDYHIKYGIPKAARIRQLEQQNGLVKSQRIVGGSPSDISQTPYQVGLVIQILWIFTSVCGGSVLSANRVITAAHCQDNGIITAQSYTAVFGSNTLFSGGQRIVTNDITMHPGWNYNTAANDIAVIRLPVNIGYSVNVQPIALPTGNELSQTFNGWQALASGYGLTSDVSSITTAQVVSSVPLQIITNQECSAVFSTWVHNTNICTSGVGGRSVCSGDSGGPLVVESNGRRILVGVTSFGHEDGCELGYPAAFARVTDYTTWLLSQ